MDSVAHRNRSVPGRFAGPVFIVGFGRSGTKLLRTILAQHGDVCIGDVETNFIPSLVAQWHEFGDLRQEKAFNAFYQHCSRLPYFSYQEHRGAAISADAWRRLAPDCTLPALVEALIRHDCGPVAGRRRIWGDKSPSYTRHVRLLKTHFPDARFVHIVRDVRDVVRSSSAAWRANPLRAAQRWADSVLEPRRQSAEFLQDLLELRYEDLIRDPESTVRNICEHLDIEYGPSLIRFDRAPENFGDAKGMTTILQGNTGKWADYFSVSELRRIEQIAVRELRVFGYPCGDNIGHRRLSRPHMVACRVSDGLTHLSREVRARGLRDGVSFVWQFFRQNLRSGL